MSVAHYQDPNRPCDGGCGRYLRYKAKGDHCKDCGSVRIKRVADQGLGMVGATILSGRLKDATLGDVIDQVSRIAARAALLRTDGDAVKAADALAIPVKKLDDLVPVDARPALLAKFRRR